MSKKTQNKQQRQQKRRQRKTQKKQQKCQQKQQKQRKTQKRQQKRQQQRRSRKQQLKKKQRGGYKWVIPVISDDDIEKINKILGWLETDYEIEIKKLNRTSGNVIDNSKRNAEKYIKVIKEKKVLGKNLDNFLLLFQNPDLAVEYFHSDWHIDDIIMGINKSLEPEQKMDASDKFDIKESFRKKKAEQTQSQSTPRNQHTTTHAAAAATETTGSTTSTEQTQSQSTPRSQPTTTHAAAATETTGSTTSTEQTQKPLTFDVKQTKTENNIPCYLIKKINKSP